MVNTFLITSDFHVSASLLDMKRLGKQRVEAMQILNILIDLDYLSWYFEVIPPSRGCSKEDFYLWIGKLLNLYRNLPHRFIWDIEDPTDPILVPGGVKYQRAKDNEIFIVEDNTVHLSTKTGRNPREIPLDQFLFPGERVLGDGLRKHPVLLLWYTYPDALAEYINIHIEEWISRGYKNNMFLYEVPEMIEYPDWVFNPEFHRRMQARLREKELQGMQDYQEGKRKTSVKEWYTTMDLFLKAGSDDGYLW